MQAKFLIWFPLSLSIIGMANVNRFFVIFIKYGLRLCLLHFIMEEKTLPEKKMGLLW